MEKKYEWKNEQPECNVLGGIFVKKWTVFLTVTVFTLGIAKYSNGGINCANAPNRVIVSGPTYVEVNQSATYTCTVDTQGGTFAWTHPGFSNPQITTSGNKSTLTVQAQGSPSTSATDKKKVKCVYTRPEGACDGYVDAIIFKIALDNDLWWFNNENPQGGYNITATLSVQPMSTGTFKWDVTAGASKVDLNNDGATADSITATDDNTITVKSTAASTAAANVTKDVTIQLSYNGTVLGGYDIVIAAPDHLVHLIEFTNSHPTFGYETKIYYRIEDQFNRTLPSYPTPLNESWTTGIVDDYSGMDWRRGPTGGGLVNPVNWSDAISGEISTKTPTPISPSDLGSGIAVYHWSGLWKVGSSSNGAGRTVGAPHWQGNPICIWQKYRGGASHE